ERVRAGKEITLGAQGGQPAEHVEKLARKMSDAQMDRLRELGRNSRGGVTVFRSEGAKQPPAVRPIPGSTVLIRRPTLSWNAVPSAARYEVRLFSLSSDKPLWKSETTETRLPYPDKQPDLPAGVTRLWRVAALDRDGKLLMTLESRFTVAPEEELKGLDAINK